MHLYVPRKIYVRSTYKANARNGKEYRYSCKSGRSGWLSETDEGEQQQQQQQQNKVVRPICGILATHMPACPRQSQGERVSLETVE